MTKITDVRIDRLLPRQGSRTSLRRAHRSRKTKPARTSSSPQRTLSVPVTTRIAGAGPGSPFGPADARRRVAVRRRAVLMMPKGQRPHPRHCPKAAFDSRARADALVIGMLVSSLHATEL